MTIVTAELSEQPDSLGSSVLSIIAFPPGLNRNRSIQIVFRGRWATEDQNLPRTPYGRAWAAPNAGKSYSYGTTDTGI